MEYIITGIQIVQYYKGSHISVPNVYVEGGKSLAGVAISHFWSFAIQKTKSATPPLVVENMFYLFEILLICSVHQKLFEIFLMVFKTYASTGDVHRTCNYYNDTTIQLKSSLPHALNQFTTPTTLQSGMRVCGTGT